MRPRQGWARKRSSISGWSCEIFASTELRCASSTTKSRSWPTSRTALLLCRTETRLRRDRRETFCPMKGGSPRTWDVSMLQLRDLTAHYGKNEVLSEANIVLNPGEVVALI